MFPEVEPVLAKTIRQIVASGLPKEEMFNELSTPANLKMSTDTLKRIMDSMRQTNPMSHASFTTNAPAKAKLMEQILASSPERKILPKYMDVRDLVKYQKEYPRDNGQERSFYSPRFDMVHLYPPSLAKDPSIWTHETQHKLVEGGYRPMSVVVDNPTMPLHSTVRFNPTEVNRVSDDSTLYNIAAPKGNIQLKRLGNYFDWANTYRNMNPRYLGHELDAMFTQTAMLDATKQPNTVRTQRIIHNLLEKGNTVDTVEGVLKYYKSLLGTAAVAASGIGRKRSGE